ncbi:MAG: hypothetical protein WC397_03410 [Candidatus Paceibacterota bacterium]|jgi:type III secretory pathway component EscU
MLKFIGFVVFLLVLFFSMPEILPLLGLFINLLGALICVAAAVFLVLVAVAVIAVVLLAVLMVSIIVAVLSAIGWLVSSAWNALTPSAISINGQQGLLLLLSVLICIEVFKARKACKQAKKTDDPKVFKS